MPELVLRTKRLILRRWRWTDREPFAAMSADPAVMEFLLPLDGHAASDALADRIEALFAEHGFGLWAVEIPDTAPFIGMAGLARPSFRPPGTAEVELAWRLARPYWGRGYATEAARAAASFGFDELGLDEILAVTVPANGRSQAVMQRWP